MVYNGACIANLPSGNQVERWLVTKLQGGMTADDSFYLPCK